MWRLGSPSNMEGGKVIRPTGELVKKQSDFLLLCKGHSLLNLPMSPRERSALSGKDTLRGDICAPHMCFAACEVCFHRPEDVREQ